MSRTCAASSRGGSQGATPSSRRIAPSSGCVSVDCWAGRWATTSTPTTSMTRCHWPPSTASPPASTCSPSGSGANRRTRRARGSSTCSACRTSERVASPRPRTSPSSGPSSVTIASRMSRPCEVCTRPYRVGPHRASGPRGYSTSGSTTGASPSMSQWPALRSTPPRPTTWNSPPSSPHSPVFTTPAAPRKSWRGSRARAWRCLIFRRPRSTRCWRRRPPAPPSAAPSS